MKTNNEVVGPGSPDWTTIGEFTGDAYMDIEPPILGGEMTGP